MNVLQALCGVVLFIHILDAISTDCTTKIYVSSNGFSCYPCPPGFHVLKECQRNASMNICIPCPKGTYQPNCSTKTASCAMCHSCPEPRQKISRNCTRTQDTTCACLEDYFLDTDQVCLPVHKCPAGKKITQGDEGEGLLCVPCEADTFSNRNNSRNCQQCSTCYMLNYMKNCTKTSDAICHQLTTERVTTDKVTTNNYSAQEECNCAQGIDLTVVLSVVLGTIVAAFIVAAILLKVFIKCKWLEYSTKFPKSFPCSKRSEKKDTDQDEELEVLEDRRPIPESGH